MMMTMCWKFGTRGRGVAVGEGVGKRVAVGGTSVNVGAGVAEGTADAMLGGAEVAQAANKTSKMIQTPNRFIQTFLKNRHSSLAKVDVVR